MVATATGQKVEAVGMDVRRLRTLMTAGRLIRVDARQPNRPRRLFVKSFPTWEHTEGLQIFAGVHDLSA